MWLCAMSASVRSLALYDLLAPQFLLGFSFPDYIDKYLSVLSVADLQTTSDDNAVLHTGTVYFPVGSPPHPPQHTDPSGAVFDFHDITFRFRLLIPRSGSSFIQTAVNDIPSLVFPPSLEPLKDNVFGSVASPSQATDAPGIGFQLDLLLTVLTFHLGPHWLPAVQNADFTISPNPGSPPHTDVEILMPQILLRYSQGEDFSKAPSFEVAAWGDPGFDAPNDLAEGQLATMVPPLAIHSSGRVAFGVQTIILDLSSNGAPPEILQFFGTDDDFKGLYIKSIQVYYTDSDKDLALNFIVRDALISFAGEIWLDAELDVIFDAFTVAVTAWDGSNQLTVNTGSQLSPSVWHGGSLTMPSTGVLYLQIAGGIPPYKESVTFSQGPASPPASGGQQLWDDAQRLAQAPTITSGEQEAGALVITVTDSTAPTPQKYSNNLAFTVSQSNGSAGTPPAPPAPPSNAKPHALRRLSIQLRLEKNTVVLADISGEYDFAAQTQSAVPGGSPATGSNSLGVTNTPAATTSSSPPSGIVDFDLNVTYDLETGDLTETLTLGAVPSDANGLLQMTNPSDNMLKDILGVHHDLHSHPERRHFSARSRRCRAMERDRRRSRCSRRDRRSGHHPHHRHHALWRLSATARKHPRRPVLQRCSDLRLRRAVRHRDRSVKDQVHQAAEGALPGRRRQSQLRSSSQLPDRAGHQQGLLAGSQRPGPLQSAGSAR